MDSSKNAVELTLEQQFSIMSFGSQVDQMNLEQAQDFLKHLYTHMITKEAVYKELLKKEWGLDSNLPLPNQNG